MAFAPPRTRKSTVLSSIILFLMLATGFTASVNAASHPANSLRTVALTMDDVKTSADQTFQVWIYISDVTGLDVTAFNFAIDYEADLLAVTSATLEGTMSGVGGANMTLAYNTNEAGRIAMAAAGVEALQGAGGLVVVNFQSKSVDGIASLSISDITLNEGNPVAEGGSSVVTISSELTGDASLNGEVSAFDAALVLQHAAFIDTLDTPAYLAADVSANGEVSSYDAALILQRVSGIIDCFPVEDGCDASKHGSDVQVDVNWDIARPDGMVVHLNLNDIRGEAHSISINIASGDRFQYAFESLPEGWMKHQHITEEGMLRITMAGATPLEAGSLLTITGTDASLSLDTSIRFNEEATMELADYEQGNTPASFTLAQNYPNPFNPTTTIQYSLTNDVHVSLFVYDMLGREVARLVDEPQAAGIHQATFDAASLPSGAYLYRLEAGANVQTRKMTLVK